LILPNSLDDDTQFTLKQIATGMDEGICRIAQHEDRIVAMMLARADPMLGTMNVLDIRIDCEFRRQGLATVLLYQLIEEARQADLRAVSILTKTNNAPAAALLEKLGFELSGLDTRRDSNHDLVKESATLIWYYPIH
jgi:ribosomal protein S18 acetylase RimI-like enzyme